MSKLKEKIYYDKKTDVLWLNIKSGAEEECIEVTPGVNWRWVKTEIFWE